MKKLLAILLCFAIVLSLAACGQQKPESVPADAQSVPEEVSEPTPEPTPEPFRKDPLTGEDAEEQGSRPVAVMVQNTDAALPQWGISDAEVLIEALTIGRDSALMALYPSVDSLNKVGPVAPLNDLMLQMVLPINAIPVHNGINVYASNLLNLLEYQDLDGTYIGTISFDYDKERKAQGYNDEFCWYTNEGLVHNGLDTYGTPDAGELTSLFRFEKNAHKAAKEITANELNICYGNTVTSFGYDPELEQYRMYRGEDEQLDANDDSGVLLDNLIILWANAGVKDDEFTRDYDLSNGVGWMLTRGGWQEILWQKNGATGLLMLYDTEGKELSVNMGRSYLGVYGDFDFQWIELYDANGEQQPLPRTSQD